MGTEAIIQLNDGHLETVPIIGNSVKSMPNLQNNHISAKIENM